MVLATRTRNGMAPEIRELVDLADLQGWDIDLTASGRVKFSKPGQDPVFCSSNPNDYRAWLNARADLERHGLDLRRQRRRRQLVNEAIQAQPVPDLDLERMATDLLDYATNLEDMVARLIRRLHDDDEAGLHAWNAKDCQRVCGEALALIRAQEGDTNGAHRH